jgi:hypothetical protein
MKLLLEEFIIKLPYNCFGPELTIYDAINAAREEFPPWNHCSWDAWEIGNDLYCVTRISLCK